MWNMDDTGEMGLHDPSFAIICRVRVVRFQPCSYRQPQNLNKSETGNSAQKLGTLNSEL